MNDGLSMGSNAGPWSHEEQEILLNAMSNNPSLPGIVSEVSRKTGRSIKSVERRLAKMGFMHTSGQTFRTKQGFVS